MEDNVTEKEGELELHRDENFREGIGVHEATGSILDLFAEASGDGEPDADILDDPDDTFDEDEDDEVGDDEDLEDDDEEDEESDDDDDEEDDESDYDDDDDEDDDEDTDDSDDSTTLHKVTVDGVEEEVTLQGALDGYMRQADYTKKSMVNAEIKKEYVAKANDVLRLEKELVEKLDTAATVLRGGLPENPDWPALKAQVTADQYVNIRDEWDQRQAVLKQVADQKEATLKAARERQEALTESRLVDENEKLLALVPEWLDPATRRKEQDALVEVAMEGYNITPEELELMVDHRFLLLLRDAAKGRAAEEKGSKAKDVKRRTRRKTKNLKPGTRKSTSKSSKRRGGRGSKSTRSAEKRLAQSGSIHDATAALIEEFM